MKLQDLGFLAVFIILVVMWRPKWLLIAGLVSLAAAIPLFATWTFFTAERFSWYGGAFILASLLIQYIA